MEDDIGPMPVDGTFHRGPDAAEDDRQHLSAQVDAEPGEPSGLPFHGCDDRCRRVARRARKRAEAGQEDGIRTRRRRNDIFHNASVVAGDNVVKFHVLNVSMVV